MTNRTRKKVLFLITKSNWGGAQRYVYDLATALDQTRYEVVVALGGNGELKTKLEKSGIRIVALNSAQRNISFTKEIGLFGELFKIVRDEDPAVFHVNSSKAGGIGCFIGRLCGVRRVIFTAHGWAFNEDRPAWQKFIIKYFHWLTVLFSHQTIAVSRAIVDQMNWPLAQKKMVVINPGRNLPNFKSKLEARQTIVEHDTKLAPHQADVWLMIIAELHPIKQHGLLFSSLQNIVTTHPKVRLICIGDGQLRQQLAQSVIDKDLENNIFLVGAVHEAARLLKAADLFVLPSKSESYGYVLHEAGLAQVPVIASNVGGIKDIVSNHSQGTLIKTKDGNDLVKTISDFLDTPHLYQTKARELAHTLKNRTVENMMRSTTAIYESRMTESSNAAAPID